jgi:hypothetical protein
MNISTISGSLPISGGERKTEPVTQKKFLETLLSKISENEAYLRKIPAHLPKELTQLVELQQITHGLQLRVELITKAADSSTGAVKRLQQLGSQG